MKKGFTLIELLAVVLIMGILTAIALPQYRQSVERTRVAEALQMLPALQEATVRLLTENGYSSPEQATSAGFTPTFAKLDIEMKGKVVDGKPSVWKTNDFTYLIQNGSAAARLEKGLYKGTLILFSPGMETGCCYPSAKPDACERLNLDVSMPPTYSICQTFNSQF